MNEELFTIAVRELAQALGKLVIAVGNEYVAQRSATPSGNAAGRGPIEPDFPLLSKPELAERLGVTVRSVDTWMANGHIPYLKIGRTVRFSLKGVSSYVKEKYRVQLRAVR